MEIILFVVGLAVFFVIPGLLILDMTGIHLNGLTRFNIAIITGIISTSIVYKLFGYLGLPWLAVVYFLLVAIAYAVSRYRKMDDFKLQLPDMGAVVVYLLFIILIAYTAYQYTQIPSYSLNLVESAGGTVTAVKNKDALLHLSLVNEIARGLPPSTPFISGIELKYHYGMDLLSALFVKYLGFTAGDAALRYMPLFAMLLALLSIFTLVREMGGSLLSALIISFLVIWADDFSYILYQWVIYGGGFEGMSARLYYSPPSFYSLFFINPMIYGVAFLFSSFLLIDKYMGTKSNRYLILAAIVICYAGQFKVFITLQILVVLAMLTLWEVYKDRRNIATNTIFRLFAATMVVFVVMYFPTILDSLSGASLVKMELQLFTNYIPDTIKNLGMTNIPPIDSLYAVYVNKDIGLISAMLLLISVLVYTIFSFGLRIIAFPYMFSEVRKGENATLIMASLFIIIGPILTLFMSIRPLHVAGGYNNSVWFIIQSKYLIWLFLFIPLTSLFAIRNIKASKMMTNIIVIAIFVYLAYYSVKANRLLLDYFKYTPIYQPVPLDEKYVSIIKSLEQSCENGDIFISDDYWISYILVGNGCRTVLFAEWGGTFAGVQELARRRNELKQFWEAYYKEEIDYGLLEKYQVSYVISGKTFELTDVKVR